MDRFGKKEVDREEIELRVCMCVTELEKWHIKVNKKKQQQQILTIRSAAGDFHASSVGL